MMDHSPKYASLQSAETQVCTHWINRVAGVISLNIFTVDARLSADDGHMTLVTHRIHEVHEWLLSKM
ncbi:MAG: hypothetical protein HQ556_14205 [Candidatus Marinimicrobia bacterium]|nr:hypothetical protein [Candidatus Neomarinimicrobiota bacterium]